MEPKAKHIVSDAALMFGLVMLVMVAFTWLQAARKRAEALTDVVARVGLKRRLDLAMAVAIAVIPVVQFDGDTSLMTFARADITLRAVGLVTGAVLILAALGVAVQSVSDQPQYRPSLLRFGKNVAYLAAVLAFMWVLPVVLSAIGAPSWIFRGLMFAALAALLFTGLNQRTLKEEAARASAGPPV